MSVAEKFQRLLKSAADRHNTPLFSCESLLMELGQAVLKCEVELEQAQHRVAVAVLRRHACLQESAQSELDIAQIENDVAQLQSEIAQLQEKLQKA